MTDKEKLRDIVRKAAAFSLPSNTQDFHLDMFTNSLMASGLKIGKNTNAPRWIPVTERLPEPYKDVLVVEYNGWKQKVEVNSMLSNGWLYDGMTVTHWMPLPTPPKDGDT